MNSSRNDSFSNTKAAGYSPSEPENLNNKTKLGMDEETSFDLITQLAQINITKQDASLNFANASILDESARQSKTCETNARFYSQLYDVLKRRQNIPNQKVNINRLELPEGTSADQAATATLTDTSYLGLKVQAPSVTQQQVKPVVNNIPNKSIIPQILEQKQTQKVPEVKSMFQISTQQPIQQQQQTKPPAVTQPLLPQAQAQKPPLTGSPSFNIISGAKPSTTSTPGGQFSFNTGQSSPAGIQTTIPKIPIQSTVQKSLFPSNVPTVVSEPAKPQQQEQPTVAIPKSGTAPAFSFGMSSTNQPDVKAVSEQPKQTDTEKNKSEEKPPVKPAEPIVTAATPLKSTFSLNNLLNSPASSQTSKPSLFGAPSTTTTTTSLSGFSGFGQQQQPASVGVTKSLFSFDAGKATVEAKPKEEVKTKELTPPQPQPQAEVKKPEPAADAKTIKPSVVDQKEKSEEKKPEVKAEEKPVTTQKIEKIEPEKPVDNTTSTAAPTTSNQFYKTARYIP